MEIVVNHEWARCEECGQKTPVLVRLKEDPAEDYVIHLCRECLEKGVDLLDQFNGAKPGL